MKKYPLMKPGTQAFFQEADQLPNYTLFDRIHGYVYGRWTYLYIGIGIGEHWIAKLYQKIAALLHPAEAQPTAQTNGGGIANTYHGKVVPLETAKQLVTVNEEITVPDLEQIIPYPQARSLILKNPDQIAVIDCPCRSARAESCLPLDVCLIVGEPFVSFVLEQHPQRARRITGKEAVTILEAEDERGHVHHAFFKDAMLERFYAICNCCECCCGAMQAQKSGTPMLASSGYVAAIDDDLCIGCESCASYCQFSALDMVDYAMSVDVEVCMGCGVCVPKCDQEAITLIREPSKGEPLELFSLIHGT